MTDMVFSPQYQNDRQDTFKDSLTGLLNGMHYLMEEDFHPATMGRSEYFKDQIAPRLKGIITYNTSITSHVISPQDYYKMNHIVRDQNLSFLLQDNTHIDVSSLKGLASGLNFRLNTVMMGPIYLVDFEVTCISKEIKRADGEFLSESDRNYRLNVRLSLNKSVEAKRRSQAQVIVNGLVETLKKSKFLSREEIQSIYEQNNAGLLKEHVSVEKYFHGFFNKSFDF